MEREQGWIICRNGKVTRGETVTGTENEVTIPLVCPVGSKPIAVVHTHPNNDPCLSLQDMVTGLLTGLPVCVETKSAGIKCYRVKGIEG